MIRRVGAPTEDAQRRDRDEPAGAGHLWFPVLTEAAGQRALDVVRTVAQRIAGQPPGEISDASLSGGLAGRALLYASLERSGLGNTEELAFRFLDDAIDVVSSSAMGASFYSGFTGVGWAAQIVDGMLDAGGDDRSEVIDDALLQLLRKVDWSKASFDLINGLCGLGVYALERLPLASARECAEQVVDRLDEVARRDDDGVYWWTGPHLIHARRPEHPEGNADLGVAHGVPGVVAFLSRACAAGVAEGTARPLLDGAVSWLRHWAVPGEPATTIPYFYAPGVPAVPARSAWCYGDPGVAAALLTAARAVGEPSWESDAIALARRAASRPVHETGVTDAGFCHGTAGLGHLFNRMYQATGEPELADAARYWLHRTLDWCPSADALLSETEEREVGFPWDGGGVLEGAAGVALVLLAAATPVEPAWDRMFLVSAPEALDPRRHPGSPSRVVRACPAEKMTAWDDGP